MNSFKRIITSAMHYSVKPHVLEPVLHLSRSDSLGTTEIVLAAAPGIITSIQVLKAGAICFAFLCVFYVFTFLYFLVFCVFTLFCFFVLIAGAQVFFYFGTFVLFMLCI